MGKRLYITFRLKSIISVALVAVLVFSVSHLSRRYLVGVTADIIEDNTKTVIIDAGHGGEDGGTQSKRGVLEKDINLAIALKINSILKGLSVDTVMIRNGDYLLYSSGETTIRQKKVADIRKRTEITNESQNSLLLSIHQNYYTESKYSGVQVFYSPNNPISGEIAQSVQNTVVAQLQPDNTREIKASGSEIYLLHHAQVPAIMVECGFLSNEAEAEKLCDEEYQRQIALAIVEGILKYI